MKTIITVVLSIMLIGCTPLFHDTKTDPWFIQTKELSDKPGEYWYYIEDAKAKAGGIWILSDNSDLQPGDYVVLCREQ